MRERVPFPTSAERTSARENEIVGVAVTSNSIELYLKCAFHKGDIQTVYVDRSIADRLLAALRALSPASEQIPKSTVSPVSGDDGLSWGGVQEGYLQR